MAEHLWSVGEAEDAKSSGSESEALGYAVGLLTWVLASGVFVFAKSAADQAPPWTLCFWRVLLAALVLAPFVRGAYGAMWQLVRHRGIEVLVIGALGLGITQGLAFTALHYTSAVNFGIIFSTTPILTLVLAAIVLREVLGPWQVLGSLIAFGGIVAITVQGDPALLFSLKLGLGDLLVIVSCVTFSSYTVLLKRAKFELARLPLLLILMVGGAIASFPFFLYELATGQHDNFNIEGYTALAYMVIVGGALMYLCYNRSIEILGASRAGALLYSQMIFTGVLAWLFLGESIEWYQYLGSGLIIIGIVLVSFLKPKTHEAAT